MSARDIDLTYAPDRRTLQAARLMESAVVDLPAHCRNRRAEGRRADDRFLGFAADGSTVTRLDAQQNVQVDLPGDE